jgi:hypothetical protein
LMLEPPRATPSEVTEAIQAEDVRSALAVGRAGLFAVVGSLAFSPLLWWIAPHASAHVLALTVLLVVTGLATLHSVVTGRPRPGLIVIGNAVIVAVVARMFSPVLIAPGIAALLAMALVLTPRFSVLGSAAGVGALMCAGVIAPLVLERAGVLSTTVVVGESGVLLQPPAISGHEGPVFVVAVFYIVALIGAACVMADMMRRRTRAAHEHLHLQAWQLRQLVPR